MLGQQHPKLLYNHIVKPHGHSIMEANPNSSSPENNTNPNKFSSFLNLDLTWIFGRIQEVMLNPNECWDKIKSEALLTKDLFSRYVIPLSLLSAVCGFIGQSIIGIDLPYGTYRIPFFPGLVFNIVSFAASLSGFFVSAFIMEKLAPKFETQVSQDQVLRLIGFAATPNILSGVLNITPGLFLAFIGALLSLYSLFLLWAGFKPMTEVPENRKVAFFASWLICSFVALLVLFGIVSTVFGPAMPEEVRDLQKFQENIQKLMPNASH